LRLGLDHGAHGGKRGRNFLQVLAAFHDLQYSCFEFLLLSFVELESSLHSHSSREVKHRRNIVNILRIFVGVSWKAKKTKILCIINVLVLKNNMHFLAINILIQ
jgi:hypothetical protein